MDLQETLFQKVTQFAHDPKNFYHYGNHYY